MANTNDVRDRFWSKVDRRGPDECWPWKAGRSPDGYGKVMVHYRNLRAHRLAVELSAGTPLAPGAVVRHRCDNPPCCNPAHLVVGTTADNVADKVSKGRQARGEGNGGAKLRADQVADIRRLLDEGHTQVEVAKAFGITQANVSIIKLGRSWATSGERHGHDSAH